RGTVVRQDDTVPLRRIHADHLRAIPGGVPLHQDAAARNEFEAEMHDVALLFFSLPVAHQVFQPFEHGVGGGGGHGLGGQAASREQNHDGQERKTTANHKSLPENVVLKMST